MVEARNRVESSYPMIEMNDAFQIVIAQAQILHSQS
jgi:hypothetical protein